MPVPFSPPANIDDLNENAREAWSEVVHGWFKQAERRLPSGHRFFNIADADLSDAVPKTIPWDGFPRKLALLLPTDLERRWAVAEQVYSQDLFGRRTAFYVRNSSGDMEPVGLPFRDQDEYCEWRTVREESNCKIKRIVFTCENPEYWYHIAGWDEPTLVRLYSELAGANVPRDDLFFHTDVFRPSYETGELQWINQNGRYNTLNKWDTTHGLVHLTHPANSLAAEVFLAADATILRFISFMVAVWFDQAGLKTNSYPMT